MLCSLVLLGASRLFGNQSWPPSPFNNLGTKAECMVRPQDKTPRQHNTRHHTTVPAVPGTNATSALAIDSNESHRLFARSTRPPPPRQRSISSSSRRTAEARTGQPCQGVGHSFVKYSPKELESATHHAGLSAGGPTRMARS